MSTTTTLQPDGTSGADASMTSGGSADTNYGTGTVMSIGYITASLKRYHALLKFDLSSLPSNARIQTATLTLVATAKVGTTGTNNIQAYRCLRAWTEAGATWNRYDGTNAWGTAGADNTTTDREATSIGSGSVDWTAAVPITITIALTPSKVTEWINGSLTNNGMVLIRDADTATNQEVDVATSDSLTTSQRPSLALTYTTGRPGPRSLLLLMD